MKIKYTNRHIVIQAICAMCARRYPNDPWRRWALKVKLLKIAVARGIY